MLRHSPFVSNLFSYNPCVWWEYTPWTKSPEPRFQTSAQAEVDVIHGDPQTRLVRIHRDRLILVDACWATTRRWYQFSFFWDFRGFWYPSLSTVGKGITLTDSTVTFRKPDKCHNYWFSKTRLNKGNQEKHRGKETVSVPFATCPTLSMSGRPFGRASGADLLRRSQGLEVRCCLRSPKMSWPR